MLTEPILSLSASFSFSAKPPPSGYKPSCDEMFVNASLTFLLGPIGFSFEASLSVLVTPSSRSSSSIGLPG